jgi:thiamine-phosphate pyrophosphorylase
MTRRHEDLPRRLALTDQHRGGSPFEQLEHLHANDALILRHYNLPDQERSDLARALRKTSHARGVRLLIAGSQKLAAQVKADGLHLPIWLLKRGYDWRTRFKPDWIITAAAHNQAELVAATRCGVDAALLSPAFATGSHPGAKTLGPVKFAALAGRANVPVYALGGATAASMQRLAHVENLAGWAAVSRV